MASTLLNQKIKQVLVHNPDDFPDVGSRGFSIDLSNEIFVGVTAQQTERSRVRIQRSCLLTTPPLLKNLALVSHTYLFYVSTYIAAATVVQSVKNPWLRTLKRGATELP